MRDDVRPADRRRQALGVEDVALDDLDIVAYAGEVLVQAGAEVVVDGDTRALPHEVVDEVRADEPGAAGDDDPLAGDCAHAVVSGRTFSPVSIGNTSKSDATSASAARGAFHGWRLRTRIVRAPMARPSSMS